jgi:hypothetical protein
MRQLVTESKLPYRLGRGQVTDLGETFALLGMTRFLGCL